MQIWPTGKDDPPDLEFQEWQQAADSSESATSWQDRKIPLDAERILVLDAEYPVQDGVPEFVYD